MNTKLWLKDKGSLMGHFDIADLQRAAAEHWLHPLQLVSPDKRTWTDASNYENGLLWERIDHEGTLQTENGQVWVKEKGRMLGPYSVAKLQELAANNWLSKMHLVSEDRIRWAFASHYKDGILWGTEIPTDKSKTKPSTTVKPPPESEWWYERDRQPIGPMRLTQIRNLFGIGELQSNQLVWTSGMDDWKPAQEISEFQRYVKKH